jgi:hypothetical protein
VKSPLALVLVAILVFVALPATAADRACRPSLSNFYHCPDSSPSAAPTTKTATPSGRACQPSLSNFWTCPDNSQTKRRSASAGRPCRPSLSNGYSCPKASGPSATKDTRISNRGRPPKQTVSTEEGGCRPSLSNGYKCPGSAASTDANQYTTEAMARLHCPGGTVVWANTRSNIYHFRGTANYGNTKAGAYMCEGDSISEGMRAAKNETHP